MGFFWDVAKYFFMNKEIGVDRRSWSLSLWNKKRMRVQMEKILWIVKGSEGELHKVIKLLDGFPRIESGAQTNCLKKQCIFLFYVRLGYNSSKWIVLIRDSYPPPALDSNKLSEIWNKLCARFSWSDIILRESTILNAVCQTVRSFRHHFKVI